MKKFMTKTLSAFLCIAFTGLQMSFADVLTTGAFKDTSLLNGAAVIKGHTKGLENYAVRYDGNGAALYFNANTRIDWSKFNVYNGQELLFYNGNFGVLNNVVGGSISKIAGLIKAENGKIIISNPNGILFQGGRFESLGGLVLTTKDLTNINIDTTDLNSLDLKAAPFGENVAIVAIVDNSNITAADINIISHGIHVDGSTLATKNGGDIILTTTDGSNFLAVPRNAAGDIEFVMTADDSSVKKIGFEYDNTIQIADTAISTLDGTLKLTSGAQASVYGCTGDNAIKANVDADVYDFFDFANNTVQGDLKVRVWGAPSATNNIYGEADITNTKVYGSATFDVNDLLWIRHSTFGTTNIVCKGITRISNNSKINGDLTIDTFSLHMGHYNGGAQLDYGSILTVGGDIKATVTEELGFSDTIIANSIDMTSKNSSIMAASGKNIQAQLIADDIKLTANNGSIVSLNADPVNKTSDFFKAMNAERPVSSFAQGTVKLNGENATVSAGKNVALDTTLTGDLDVTKATNAFVTGTVGKNLNVDAGTGKIIASKVIVGEDMDLSASDIVVKNSTVRGDATLTDVKDDGIGIEVKNSNITGSLTATAKNEVILNDITAADTTVTAGDFARVEGDSEFDNLTINAFTVTLGRYLSAGSPDFPEGAVVGQIIPGTITVKNNLVVNSDDTIGYSSAINAKNITMTSRDSSIFQAVSDTGSGSLTANNITLTAQNGYVVALDGNPVDGTSDYIQGLYNTVDKTNFKSVFGFDPEDSKAITVSSVKKGGDLELNMNTAGFNVNAKNAENVTLNVVADENGNKATLENAKLEATGNIIAKDIKVERRADDSDNKSGNAEFISQSGSLTLDNITADTNIIGTVDADKATITASGLVADAEGNSVGDIILTGKNGNITLTGKTDSEGKVIAPSSGENVKITTGGNVTAKDIAAGKNDGTNDTQDFGSANQGDVVISAGGNVIAERINAEDDIKITSTNGSINGKDLNADKDRNGDGDLILNGATVSIIGGSGANVDVVALGDIKAEDITTVRPAGVDNGVAGTASFESTTGSLTLDNITADTNIIGTVDADKATITASGLVADAEGNGVGDIILTGKNGDITLTGKTDSEGKVIAPSSGENVKITTGGNVTAKDIVAGKNDGTNDTQDFGSANQGDVVISAGGNVIAERINAEDDIKITSTNGSINGKDLNADKDRNGDGDLILNGLTVSIIGGSGANVDVTASGDITASDITTVRPAGVDDDVAGTASFESTTGSLTLDNITADTDIIGTVNGDGATITASGLVADAEGNGVGDIILTAKDGDITLTGKTDSEGKVIAPSSGENVIITTDGNVTAKDIDAGHQNGGDGKKDQGQDRDGDVVITAGGNVTAEDVTAADDIVINAGGNVDGDNLIADSDNSGEGDLIITGKNVDVDGGSGENVNITANGDPENGDGNVTVSDIDAGHKDGGDGKKDRGEDQDGDVVITANGDVTAEDVTAADDIVINAGGNVDGDNLIADSDNSGEGDLIITGKNVDVDGGSGENVNITANGDPENGDGNVTVSDIDAGHKDGGDGTRDRGEDQDGDVVITANGDVTAEDVTAADDIVINAGGDVDADHLTADSDNNGEGDLIINAGGDVDLNDGNGENIEITAGDDVNVEDLDAADDIIITAGDDVTGHDLIADGDNDGIGEIIINAGGDVTIDDAHGNDIVIDAGGKVIITNSTPMPGNDDFDLSSSTLTEEVIKNFNNLQQSGVNTSMAQSFTPIAFAAADDDDEQSMLAKRIAKTVFKLPNDDTVTITDKFVPIK